RCQPALAQRCPGGGGLRRGAQARGQSHRLGRRCREDAGAARRASTALTTTTNGNNHVNKPQGSGIMKLHALGISVLTAGAMALAVFLASGQARAADPIIIGAAIALSGPIAPYDEGPYKAMEVAVDEINAKGGVLGRP